MLESKALLDYFKGDELAAKVWLDKYALRSKSGELLEQTPDDMHHRLAKEFARIEAQYGGSDMLSEPYIYNLFKDFKYIIPGGSVMAGLGSNFIGSLSNCFVIGQPEDSYSGIMKIREEQCHLMKRRGGVGKDLSTLRPAGSAVNNAAKSSTGAASFMDVDSAITNEVAQRGRRGALMLTLDVRHPDIEEFVTKKQDLSKVTGANISVKVTDDFMKAVHKNEDFILRWPIHVIPAKDFANSDSVPYNTLLESYTSKVDKFYFKKVKARELWEKIIHCAWNTAEPGIMFEDRHLNYSPDGVYPQYAGVSTNPCGEIFMQPYDSCRLLHINLTAFVKDPFSVTAKVDYNKLKEVAHAALRLGDDLVDLEIEAIDRILGHIKSSKGDNDREYILWQTIKETAINSRRCGVGFTGLSDMLAMLGTSIDHSGIFEVVEGVMKCLCREELCESMLLAQRRGTFAGWDPSLEHNDWYDMVAEEFPDLYKNMQVTGRRNVSFSTVAPTGTVSILAQCSSGIEPVFSIYYTRRKKCSTDADRVDFIDQNGEKFTEFRVFHPTFIKWYQAVSGKSWQDAKVVLENESKEGLDSIIKGSPWYEQTASEIDWKVRVLLQSVVQKFTTHSISSTVNLPNTVTESEVNDIYKYAWEAKLKGITVYRDGCRSGVLVTDATSGTKFEQHSAPKRPKSLNADLHVVKVKGIKYAVIVGLMESKPYEVFAFELGNGNFLPQKGKIVKVKRGYYNFIGDEDLIIESIHLANDKVEERASSIYISMLLRHGAPIEYVVATAKKVNDNIASFTSAVCRVLLKYTTKDTSEETCPECGSKIIREAGCKKCSNCGYSLCLLMLGKL